ncbi:MAG: sigma-70 family RNA polymerase sigma factor [Anaerolineae bacterium]
MPLLAASEPHAAKSPERISYLFGRYYDGLYRYLCYLTNDAENAEDFTNEVFLRLCRTLQTGAIPPEALPGWLYRVGRNLVIDEYRRHLVEANGLRYDDVTVVITPLEDTFLHLEVRSVFEQLTPEQQRVLYLRFVEGFEPSEIAALIGKSAGAVKQLQYRALASLRRRLGYTGYKP